MKKCFSCLCEKPLDAFYKHAAMRDGRLNRCIECVKASVRQNRLEKLEYYRSYDRQRGSQPERVAARKAYQQTPEYRQAHARANEKWLVTNAIRRKASAAVRNAIRSGRLTKEPCFICGGAAHAHHPNYDAPLSVVWLCPEHHKEAHAIAANESFQRGEKSTLHY